ncbi:hypothetical protein CONCODRAFT_4296 [Conidiobolus coronatus NRRL 28638]|uniref:DNA2/NAM7 helicase-like C-terminal domain-containing protein n=1 Tax=Conidiobolus coronatus (strain ATCC 28846 / CBS 209.66 / NRRL 28638) TaxID=796925 RepID=A0A137PCS6_CONC2|nr:hypothetical protein CONCODRAFT_4296 [Conidiobolus coronatus NRRL 28638]|eukprot:KXN72804.1 hypothetical protein CONCODRAFT_4296 [Conidiobolus coronatus NRRL 28638]
MLLNLYKINLEQVAKNLIYFDSNLTNEISDEFATINLSPIPNTQIANSTRLNLTKKDDADLRISYEVNTSIASRSVKYPPYYSSDDTSLDRAILKCDYNSDHSFPASLGQNCEPLEHLNSHEIFDISSIFNDNLPQARSIGATKLMNNGIYMIHGPPGTGPLCIEVGDSHQLPPAVIFKKATKFKHDYILFARVYNKHPNCAHILSIQYRMHPEISTIPIKPFYDGKFTDGSSLNKIKLIAKKAYVAAWLVESLVKQNPDVDFKNRVGVVTPYKFQLRELKKKFKMRFNKKMLDNIKFNTIDGFQGQENDIFIFSAVRSSTKNISFLSDIRGMNMGLTRAKNSLFIIANSKGLSTIKT